MLNIQNNSVCGRSEKVSSYLKKHTYIYLQTGTRALSTKEPWTVVEKFWVHSYEKCHFKILGSNPTPTTTQLHVPVTQSWATEGHQKWHCCQWRVKIPTPHPVGMWLLSSLLLRSLSTDRLLCSIRRKDVICLIIHMTSPFFLVPQFLLEVPHL